ncbi:MAG: GNAT family N-acetyltransferase [Eubacteriales bacterium]|nr:GNAT family N-acetyltransferase [Eubacteriales bacterium]
MVSNMNEKNKVDSQAFLEENYEFRSVLPEETEEAAKIESDCFPPNEACAFSHMAERIQKAPELFLVAKDRRTGKLAGFLNGLSTDKEALTDDFFTDADTYEPEGKNVMLLGLAVLPQYRGQGLARELVKRYREREKEKGRRCLVLTCKEEKVAMYKKFGFCDRGIGVSNWGGERWHEMSLPTQG